ncbi:hypothetical protein K438DRAFT_1964108 [Mycena galopus ATCC 62051]|nr:hypothetical protein K438DRAFT_1964108 [Mycena galopus ATCC 62051]
MPSHTRSPHAQPHSSPTNGLLHLATRWFAVHGITPIRINEGLRSSHAILLHISLTVFDQFVLDQHSTHRLELNLVAIVPLTILMFSASFIAYPHSLTLARRTNLGVTRCTTSAMLSPPRCYDNTYTDWPLELVKLPPKYYLVFPIDHLLCLFRMIKAKAKGNLYREFFFVSVPSGISSLQAFSPNGPSSDFFAIITIVFFDLLILFLNNTWRHLAIFTLSVWVLTSYNQVLFEQVVELFAYALHIHVQLTMARMVFDDAAPSLDEDEATPVPSATNNILAQRAARQAAATPPIAPTEFICSKNVHSLIQSSKYANANVLYSLSDPIQMPLNQRIHALFHFVKFFVALFP